MDWKKKILEEFISREVEKGTKSQSESLGLDEKEFSFFEVVRKYLTEKIQETDVVKEEAEVYVSNDVIELSKTLQWVLENQLKIIMLLTGQIIQAKQEI